MFRLRCLWVAVRDGVPSGMSCWHSWCCQKKKGLEDSLDSEAVYFDSEVVRRHIERKI